MAEFIRGLCDADFGQRLGGKRDAQALKQELSGEQKFSTVGGRYARLAAHRFETTDQALAFVPADHDYPNVARSRESLVG